jgi:hypothetical protein
MKKIILALFYLLLILTGLFFSGLSIILRMPWLGFLGEAHQTTGTVVGINTWTESGVGYRSPQILFTTERGEQISIDMICWPFDCLRNYDIGSALPVIYPSNYPENAIADTVMGRIVTPLCTLLIGLVLLIAGSALFVGVIIEGVKKFKRLVKPPNQNNPLSRIATR